MNSDAKTLKDYLQSHAVGKQNALRRRHIAFALGWNLEGGIDRGIRRVKAAAEELRLNGIPIGYWTDSDSGGLYLCANTEEIKDVLGRLRRLAISVLREYRAVKKALLRSEEILVQKELFT